MEYVGWKAKQPQLINKKLMPNKKSNDWLQYSGIGTQMLITIILFWWLGGKLFSKPWGELLGLFFGIFAGMYNLVNQLNK